MAHGSDLSISGHISLLPQSRMLRQCPSSHYSMWSLLEGSMWTIIWTLGLGHLDIWTEHSSAPVLKDVQNHSLISSHAGFPGLFLQALQPGDLGTLRRQKAFCASGSLADESLDNFPSSLSCSSWPLKSRKWTITELSGRWKVPSWEQALAFDLPVICEWYSVRQLQSVAVRRKDSWGGIKRHGYILLFMYLVPSGSYKGIHALKLEMWEQK